MTTTPCPRAALALLAALLVAGSAGADAGGGPPAPCAFDHSHAAWTRLLARHVHDGMVDYPALRTGGAREFSAYLASLQAVSAPCYDTWTSPQRLAFWLNAYNAYTVALVLDHWPLRSIRTIGILPGAAFRKRFIPLERLRSGALSLDDIEHTILRPRFAEPRIHFALVCASTSCPPLRSEAYRPDALEEQLDEQTRRFIGDPSKNRWDAEARVARLSPIFDWFAEDFERVGGVRGFVARYAGNAFAAGLRDPRGRIEYLSYDWSLNGR